MKLATIHTAGMNNLRNVVNVMARSAWIYGVMGAIIAELARIKCEKIGINSAKK